jgi:hypothetical protein
VIEELPKIEPIRRRVVTYVGQCAHCGPVRTTHPAQVSTATGAAGVHLGPHALALAADLRHTTGLTLRKTCAVLKEHFGLPLSPGGLSQALARMATKVSPDYQRLQHDLAHSPSVHVDETGWWREGKHAWLWVVATAEGTLYHVSSQRDAQTLATLLGEAYRGTLVSDCLNIYDRYPAARKSKCVAHHLRAIAEAQNAVPDSPFLRGLRRLFGAALKLQRATERLPEEVYARGVASLERRLDRLLGSPATHAEEERIGKRLRQRREHLLTFLHEPGVAATNNLAERQLRPAVVTRKLSCGHKTREGARAWEVLASLAATCRQRGQRFVDLVAKRLSLSGDRSGGVPT